MTDRKLKLIESLKNELARNKIQHVHLLLIKYRGQLAIRFTNVDNDTYKKALEEITNRYCESLYFVNATKTTVTYLF